MPEALSSCWARRHGRAVHRGLARRRDTVAAARRARDGARLLAWAVLVTAPWRPSPLALCVPTRSSAFTANDTASV